jgi:hypothetical protein
LHVLKLKKITTDDCNRSLTMMYQSRYHSPDKNKRSSAAVVCFAVDKEALHCAPILHNVIIGNAAKPVAAMVLPIIAHYVT